MKLDPLRRRLLELSPGDGLEQENLLVEALQLYVLASLSRGGFFRQAAFHGGTSLRILHGLPRYSEDLDFQLLKPDEGFRWGPLLERIVEEGREEGFELELTDRSERKKAVKGAFVKDLSIATELGASLPHPRDGRRKIRVRLEVDTRPPRGAVVETKYIDFPRLSPITVHDLPSGFAGKSHALLRRAHVKGRDWFDFLWYVARRIEPQYPLLEAALAQTADGEAPIAPMNARSFVAAMAERIDAIDWSVARRDVEPFLPPAERPTLELWSASFFHDALRRFEAFSVGKRLSR